MNSTGPITTWDVNPQQVGPIYPFVDWEVWMFLACLAFCIAFTVWKFYSERDKYDHKAQQLQKSGELEKTLAADPKDAV